MLAIDENIEGDCIYIRPSQTKFEAPGSLSLEIVRTVRTPLSGHLNRQVISMLSTLGVQDNVFITLQEEMRKEIDSIMTNEKNARKLVKHSTGTRECSHIARTIISMIEAVCNEYLIKLILLCKNTFIFIFIFNFRGS
jgi:hypothetical protein